MIDKALSSIVIAGCIGVALWSGYEVGYHNGRAAGVWSGWFDGENHMAVVATLGPICDKHPTFCNADLKERIARNKPRPEDYFK